jgi:hypothetical protein
VWAPPPPSNQPFACNLPNEHSSLFTRVALFRIVGQLCGMMVLIGNGSVRISGLHVKQEIVNIIIQKVQAMGKTPSQRKKKRKI